MDLSHVRLMSKSPRKPGRQTQSKASKPELIPLDEHLAALLNPALNRERAEDAARAKARQDKLSNDGRGFGERQQAGYDPEDVENVDPELARKLGLPMSGTAKASEPEPLHPGNRKRDQGLTRADILNAAPKRVRQGNVLREEGDDAQVRGNGIVGASATMDSLKALLEAGDPNLREKSPGRRTGPARPEKSEGGIRFELVSEFEPAGRPADRHRRAGRGRRSAHERDQVLLGVTGSGKTFTMAQVIAAHAAPGADPRAQQDAGRAALRRVQELLPRQRGRVFRLLLRLLPARGLRPAHRHLHREGILDQRADRPHAPLGHARAAGARRRHHRRLGLLHLRHRLGRDLHGDDLRREGRRAARPARSSSPISSPCTTSAHDARFHARHLPRARRHRRDLPRPLRGPRLAHLLFGDEIETITEFDPLTGKKTDDLELVKVYANSHYVTPQPTLQQAIKAIKAELQAAARRAATRTGHLLEAQRLEQRTMFDLEMMEATGSCAGIENYSRYLTGRKPGEPPPTLFEYLPDNALVFVDESHVTVPQIGGMYRGDFRRKATLAEYGFRLPSCMDNRPLRFEEWDAMRPQTVVRLGHARRSGRWSRPAASSPSRSSARPA